MFRCNAFLLGRSLGKAWKRSWKGDIKIYVLYILTYYNIIFSIYMIYIDISLIHNICMIYNRYHVMCISRSPVIRLEFVHGKARVWQSSLGVTPNEY